MKERRGLEERSREERREKGMSVVERRDGWEEGSVGERDVLSYPPRSLLIFRDQNQTVMQRLHAHTDTHTHTRTERERPGKRRSSSVRHPAACFSPGDVFLITRCICLACTLSSLPPASGSVSLCVCLCVSLCVCVCVCVCIPQPYSVTKLEERFLMFQTYKYNGLLLEGV